MAKIKRYYYISGSSGFEIESDNEKIFKHVDEIYADFVMTEPLADPLFNIEIIDFDEPKEQDCFLHKGISIGKDFLFFQNWYHLLIRWKVCFIFKENQPVKVLFFSKPFISQPISSVVIEPLMQLFLTLKGYSSLHSLAFRHKNKGYFIAAPAKSAKTRLAFILKNKGAEILGEERNLISPQAETISYPLAVPLRVDYIRKSNLRLSIFNRVKLYLNEFVNFVWPGGLVGSKRATIFELFGSSQRKTELHNFFVLLPRIETKGKVIIKKINAREGVSQAASLEKILLYMYGLRDFFTAAAYMNRADLFSSHWDKLKENLAHSLAERNCFQLEFETSAEDQYLEKIADEILRV